MKPKIIKLIATCFYLGYFPFGSGTLASAVGILLYILLRNNIALYIIVTAIVTILGFLVSGEAEKLFNEKDSGKIVIDEVSGILIALFLLPANFGVIIIAFFLFRGFDMFKVAPADRLQNLKGSAGVMLDDIMAGLYTNLCFHLALWLHPLVK